MSRPPLAAFDRQIGAAVLVTILNLSDCEVEPDIRARVRAFLTVPRTDREVFDLLGEIAAEPCERFESGGQRFGVGRISAFIQTACSVARYYARPGDGPAELIDVAILEAKLKKGAV